MAAASVTQVIDALTALYSSKDKNAKKEADRWLGAFQKQPEAWNTASFLLRAENTNLETRLFAAQTFRAKITYDLRDLDSAARVSLRDLLVELMASSATGSPAVMTQLCLAMADLAIQMVEWKSTVQDMVNTFAGSPETAVWLVEFLKVLPEELTSNSRLPLSDRDFREQSTNLLRNNVDEVIRLLTMYIQSSAGSIALQENVFRCLSSWLRTGDVDIKILDGSPLLDHAFNGLINDELFDAAVDLVCEIIYQTRDIRETKALIEMLYPRFGPVIQRLKEVKAEEDCDSVRGYCRVLASAGEAYMPLIVQHPELFTALVDGILECTAYNDLDIVPITFKFWYELTNTLKTAPFESAIPAFAIYYDALVGIMIRHLHYPEDMSDWSAEERDEFREFRHEMGDTLKDCCRVLTPQKCLEKPLVMLQELLSQGQATWQQIEAPIFSLRAMGSEVPDNEDQVMPRILELLSKLPDHPKIRYAATLVISRYSLWTRKHPEYITYQLNFISAGFQDDNVAAASALALKHLCKDCSEHLIDYLGQLHPFYLNVIKSLPFNDAFEVTEAVAHVLASLPPSEIQSVLQQFCLPLAQDLHAIILRDKNTISREECVKVGDLLELISAYIEFIRPEIPLGQPHPCIAFIRELWPMFDLCLTQFGLEDVVCNQLGRCFRNCVQSYKLHFIPLLPQLMERLVSGFETSGLSVHLWVANSVVREYAGHNAETTASCFGLVERLTAILFSMMTRYKTTNIPDVIDDYFRMVTSFLDSLPTPLVQSSLLAPIFQTGLEGLSLKEVSALTSVILFYRRLLGIALSVDEYMPGDTPRTAAAIGRNGARIVELFRECGGGFINLLFNGLLYHYSWDVIPDVASIMKSLAQILPTETSQWIIEIVNTIPKESMHISEKNEFLQNYMSAINDKLWAKARRILSDFITTYRRKNARS